MVSKRGFVVGYELKNLFFSGKYIFAGSAAPGIATALNKATVANISLPVAILIWLMVYPMTLDIDATALRGVFRQPKGILLTCAINWLVQPFSMFVIALLFFRGFYSGALDIDTQKQYVAGAVILGGSPCTAMVFVWSALSHGNAPYTLVQVVVNDAILLVLYAPTLFLLLGATRITVPYDTIVLSVVLFVVVPFTAGFLTRRTLLRKPDGTEALARLKSRLEPMGMSALLVTLVLIFIFQGETIAAYPVRILMIIPPLAIQTYGVFALALYGARRLRLPFDVAAPASYIASSNFFELGVGVAMSAYGINSGATLVNVVGVLVEVPIMLSLVWIAGKYKHVFDGGVPALASAPAAAAWDTTTIVPAQV